MIQSNFDSHVKISTTDIAHQLSQRWEKPGTPTMCLIVFINANVCSPGHAKSIKDWMTDIGSPLETKCVEIHSRSIPEHNEYILDFSDHSFRDCDGVLEELIKEEVDLTRCGMVGIILRPDGHISAIQDFCKI